MMTTTLRPAEEIAALIRTRCLTPNGRESAKRKLAIMAKDSPYRAEVEEEIRQDEARWEREAPVREARAALAAAGWYWDQATDVCRKRIAGQPSLKRSLVQAIREAGLGA